MHLPSHLALSWLLASKLKKRSDRVLVAWAGVLPDLDALAALFGEAAYGRWHHVLTHGVFSATVVAVACAYFAAQKRAVLALSFLAFHLHLICDLLGSGRVWPIVYFYPFSEYEYFSPFGWALASWQNVSITAAAFLAIGWVGVTRGHTFAEAFMPVAWDKKVVEALRQRFGKKG
jgi:inner membrane protein